MSQTNKPRVAIVGFGLTGRVAALMLAEQYQLSVFERDLVAAPASVGTLAAAMLAPMAESVICEQDLAEQGLHAMTLWPELLAKLDAPVFFQQQGTVIVAHQQDRGDLLSFQRRLKPLAGHQAQSLDGRGIGALEPELAGRFHQGLYLPCEGQLDNLAFFAASLSTLKNRGVRFHEGAEAHIAQGRVNGEAFDWIIDCRGLDAKDDSPGLRGVRGEVARIYAPEVSLQRPVRLMHPRYPLYIAPKPNHEFVIGATEIESQDRGDITVRSTLELLSAAYTVHSGFAEGRVMSLRAGLRPAYKDNRPHISVTDNVIRINGLYRHGFLLAPMVVQHALQQGVL
ncbi:FAD-dependent oxidoreductase [Pseudoalteromonas sp. OOF1S-7]|uniref:FAD-dependent oxidoreductase n=1 Tax=Pseudoalteromonas sp. OOF1S-7 TaxID=2917757 RepID=UPI001EF551DD|nr:FAD-dependent oxidoreductase [Pseudoalteromonas sp. OOF1S-7]MCG7536744.1 FAD-dependent oxidoreductase [Pseudoalteromonas sp. OOF1S-7]